MFCFKINILSDVIRCGLNSHAVKWQGKAGQVLQQCFTG